MQPTAQLAAVTLDTADQSRLAALYEKLLGLRVRYTSEDFIALEGGPVLVTVHRVPDHRPPGWPSGGRPKQLHLELAVGDLDQAQASAVDVGATVAAHQPWPDRWRILLDPAGHPFCLTTQLTD